MKKFILILFIISLSAFIFAADNDPNARVIENYYLYLQSTDTLKKAYDISPKKVDFDTFKKWYQNVVIAGIKDLKKNSDGSYSLKVHIGENFGENSRQNEVSVYEVNMKVKGGKIIESKSKPVDSEVIDTLKYGSNEVLIFDDIKKNTIFFYLIDKKSGNKKILDQMKYDRFGIQIISSSITSDLFLVQYISFDFIGNIVMDLKQIKNVKMTFQSIYISKDNKYILSYGDNMMTGGGLALEFFNGQKKTKTILDENICIRNIEYFKKGSEDFIKFNIENNSGKNSSKELNLTEVVKNIK